MSSPPLPADRSLARRLRRGDARARETLIVRYLPLARSLARHYRMPYEPVDDLVQVASVALVKAADRWDPDRGTAFSSFAVPTILGELRRYFRDSTWFVRPPRELADLALQIDRSRDRLAVALGREPSPTDLARELGCSATRVAEAIAAGGGRRSAPLDEPLIVTRGQEAPEYEEAEAKMTVEGMTADLDDRARTVLRLRFGDDLLQREIAVHVGCTQVHVSRILRDSLETMRAA